MYMQSVTALEAVHFLVYFYLRRDKLEHILDTVDVTFKYKSETIKDQVDMAAGVTQSTILMKWWSVIYFVALHIIGLWPLISMSSER